MRVLFLDIDGVLNSEKGWKRDDPKDSWYWTPECVDQLKEILKACPDVKVVISSTWRRYVTLDKFHQMFSAVGVEKDRIISTTPMHLSEGPRGREIRMWLEDHPEVKKFVIVDDTVSDMGAMMPHVVKTSFSLGLTEEHSGEIIKKFGEEK